MAIVTGWLKGVKGKLDGKTLYQSNGETQIRQIVKPKNPQTEAQQTQRAIMRTVNQAYRRYKELCDHSFEGRSYGLKNMNRFMQVNAIHLRERAAELQAQGVDLWTYYNFANVSSVAQGKFIPAHVFISEGTLRPIVAEITTAAPGQYVGLLPVADNTYAAVMARYGLKRGDQLTFVTNEYDAAMGWGVNYARVIMDPRDSSGQPVSLDSEFIGEDGGITNANPRNQGYFADFRFMVGEGVSFSFLESVKVGGAGIIVSRKSDNSWLRSTCQMTMSEECLALFPQYYISLGAAADLKRGSVLYFTDDHYLNNAGQGGASASGSGSDTPTPSGQLQLQSVVINGTTVDAAGGSTMVSFPVDTIKLNGVNLDSVPEGQYLGLRAIDIYEFEAPGYEMSDRDIDADAAPLIIGIFSGENLVRTLFTINADEPIENRP